MNIGLVGTGNLSVALGTAWAAAKHSILVTGRDDEHARVVAERIGHGAAAVAAAEFARECDVVVVAIPWDGLTQALGLVGGPQGALAGTTVVDCTNAVDYTTGQLLPERGSAAELVAEQAPGALVVKALHLFAGTTWPYVGEVAVAPVVALCGDDAGALDRTGRLVAALGGRAVVTGDLAASRQLEEAAGFVMRVVAAGANPRYAVPDVG